MAPTLADSTTCDDTETHGDVTGLRIPQRLDLYIPQVQDGSNDFVNVHLVTLLYPCVQANTPAINRIQDVHITQ